MQKMTVIDCNFVNADHTIVKFCFHNFSLFYTPKIDFIVCVFLVVCSSQKKVEYFLNRSH